MHCRHLHDVGITKEVLDVPTNIVITLNSNCSVSPKMATAVMTSMRVATPSSRTVGLSAKNTVAARVRGCCLLCIAAE